MQSVNNDMDDLFRRAAESYPLNTQGADWNKVMQGIESGRRKPMPQPVRNLERFFWMAAIFLVVVCTTFIQKAEYVKPPDLQSSNTVVGSNNETTKKLDVELGSTPKVNKGSVMDYTEKKQVHQKKPENVYSFPTKTTGPFLMPSRETSDQQDNKTNTRVLEQQLSEVEVERVTNSGALPTVVGSAQLLVKEIEPTTTQPVEIEKTDGKGFTRKFYAGLIAGPDVSTIKSQKMSNPGYSVGLLVGYQFNKRLSLETGVLWDRKDYYSTGKHFNKEKLGIPQHARVIDVDGYCKMFEIPVNIKFNWAQKSNHNLFATAGVSSYLMKKEEYDYSYDYYGTQYKYYKQYNNASRNWTSILNLSIGFEKKMGNAGSLRIEPYMKLPLKGVGVGDLPIGSKGVFVGFTRPIR